MKNLIQSRSNASTFKNFPTQNSYFSQPQNSAPMLVVIDPKVEDYQMLAAGVQEGANVFILDLKRDSIEQITELLAQQPVSALHIICHGSPGCLALGNTHLSLENLDLYSKELQTWSNFLASAPIFLYGCNVAFGEVGATFLTQLHQQTGANIAASANRIGSAQKGGDWKLEFTIGSIEAPLAFTEAVREAYTSVLVISIGPTVIAVTEGGVPVNLQVGINLTDPLTGLPIPTPANAIITLDPDNQLNLGNGAGNPVNVTIASGSAATAIQNVPVLAVNDGITEGNHTGTIVTTIASNSPLLSLLPAIISQLPPVTTTVSISDPVALPQISITPTQLALTEGGSTSLSIALPANLPTTIGNVSLTLTPGDDLDLGSGAGVATTVVLNAGTNTVNIAAIADGINEGGLETSNISIALTNPTLSSLINLPITSVPVAVTDLLPTLPQISITPTQLALTEGGSTSLSIALPANLPTTIGNVSLTLTPGDDLDLGSGAGVATTVVLNAGTNTVNIAAIADGINEGGLETSNISIALTNPTLSSLINLPITSVPVAVTDALQLALPEISISPTQLEVTEGGTSASLNITLPANLPTGVADVSLTLDPGDDLDLGNGAGVETTVVLNAGTPTTSVNIIGFADGIDEDDEETSNISIALTDPTLSNLINLPTSTVSVNVKDAETDTGFGSAITPSLVLNPNDFFTVQGSSGEDVVLGFGLNSINTSFINEIGVFVVDDAQGTIDDITPGTEGYLEAALENAQPIFSVLPDTTSLLGDTQLERNLSFEAGTILGLYLVQNGTASGVQADIAAGRTSSPVLLNSPSANPNSIDYLEVLTSPDGSYTLGWRDQSSSQSFNNIVLTARATTDKNLPVGTQLQQTQQLELIDLRGQTNQFVDFNFNIASEAAYDNTIGLYEVQDEQGTIIDESTGAELTPNDASYAEVALRQSVLNSELGNSRSALGLERLNTGAIYSPYIISNGTREQFLSSNSSNQTTQGTEGKVPLAYFGFLGANPDRVDHIRLLGNNTFGFEDLFGGGDRDYNDIVFKIDLTLAT
ncbi:DUF4347 domain-containing protein [Nostoc flagelliforme FACHB-838]|uniref:DUF4347 domain-containing protein n=1 Tax=Nostoc flagelliforme FACHB-838 TaxID=2692904 RepID=A0ABR8DGR4_9NOSO|nr:DUF4347 domain-containing protein [Nostoc flagelliforme]MBD2528454.1 DUF4347 domain-containing protein [Nostoc flagelliforme FACHB-838]